jgi:hypothetical protein
MRIKFNVLAWMAVAVLAFTSCKKDSNSGSNASIVGKWNWDNNRVKYSSNATVILDTTINAVTGEWIEFTAEGKVNTRFFDQEIDDFVVENAVNTYSVNGSKLYLYPVGIPDPGGDNEEIFDIKTLTSNKLTLYQRDTTTNSGQDVISEVWLNLSR